MATEFYTVMLKRKDGKVYADLHKTNKKIHTELEEAEADLKSKGPEIINDFHIVKLVAVTMGEWEEIRQKDEPTAWKDLHHSEQDDLILWYNRRIEDLEYDDKLRLADMFNQSRFEAWDCSDCGTRCYRGEPEDWSNFQGVCQVDHVSYPGDRDRFSEDHIRLQCDQCRMKVWK
jgi:rubrerythrin